MNTKTRMISMLYVQWSLYCYFISIFSCIQMRMHLPRYFGAFHYVCIFFLYCMWNHDMALHHSSCTFASIAIKMSLKSLFFSCLSCWYHKRRFWYQCQDSNNSKHSDICLNVQRETFFFASRNFIVSRR